MAASLPQNGSGPGRAFLLGGSVVAAGLGGFYMNMLRNKRKQEEKGTNPMFEQIIRNAYLNKDADETRPPLHAHASDVPPAFLTNEHHSGHSTNANYKNTPGYAEHGEAIRRMAPPPQRESHDGTGRVYTKSPDYVKNYDKTKRPESIVNA